MICLTSSLVSQVDSLKIDTIAITSKIITGCSDDETHHISHETQNIQNLQDSWFVKSNGPGGVATVSIRGGSSSQNNLFWNDIPLNNPMLGLNDYSLLPLGVIESIKISKGGNTAENGQGSLSGSIDIKTYEHWARPVNLDLSFGSFGQKMASLQTHLDKNKIDWQSKIFYQTADNNFSYPLNGIQDERENSNAHFNTKGTIQTLRYRASFHHQLELNYWWQSTERGIPPLTTQNESQAFQEDDQHRFNLNWRYNDRTWNINSSFAYINEHNDYYDPLIGLEAENQFKRLYHHFEIEKIINKTRLSIQNQLNHSKGISDNYLDQNTVRSISPMLSVFQDFGRIETKVLLRKEWSNLSDSPISPTFILNWIAKNGITAELKISREYRLPTLNELFWRPGGNPEVVAESGWNQELNLGLDYRNIRLHLGFYHRLINDWILWSLTDGAFFFSVENISKVRSYGSDFTILFFAEAGNVEIQGSCNYAYTKSVSEVTLSSPSIQKGDQLIYIPEHTADGSVQLKYGNTTFSTRVTYTGALRGINEDVEESLVTNIHISHTLKQTKYNIELGLGINNLLDEEYRIVERRPMPGRHFNLFLKTTIK